MTREQVIVQTISVNRRKQQCFFQVKLPRNTERIIGIETGIIMENIPYYWFTSSPELSLAVRRNVLIGSLQLQANTSPNVFYAKEIFERDHNIGAGELKLFPEDTVQEKRIAAPPINVPPDGNSFADFTVWTHGTKREEDPLSICGCSVINGQFKDAAGEYFGMDMQYKVMLYIWIERKTT